MLCVILRGLREFYHKYYTDIHRYKTSYNK